MDCVHRTVPPQRIRNGWSEVTFYYGNDVGSNLSVAINKRVVSIVDLAN